MIDLHTVSGMTMRDAITRALHEVMSSDDDAIMLGEALDTRGGAALVTYGFLEAYGAERVIETPISENALVGMALGAAVAGLNVVAEVYSADFLFCAGSEVVNDIAKWRYQHQWERPLNLVLRMPAGSAGSWSGPEHTQSIEGILNNVPGLRIVVPSDSVSAALGLVEASRIGDPVIFLEHRALYNCTTEFPLDTVAPAGTSNVLDGRILRSGDDVTLVAWGSMVHVALQAADMLAETGVSAEVVDPITIKPMNHSLVHSSLSKTGRLVIVDEGPRTGGVAADIVVCALESETQSLKQFRRVTFPDVHHPFDPRVEAALIPQACDVVAAVKSLS